MNRKTVSRRKLLKSSALLAAAAIIAPPAALAVETTGSSNAAAIPPSTLSQAPVIGSRNVTGQQHQGSAAKVYFSPVIDAASLIRLYNLVNDNIYGKVAIKVHTGEPNGPNILPRDMVKAFQAQVPQSAIVETNTLYQGNRDTTEKHRETLKVNGWTFCPVDILDENGDVALPVADGFHLKEVSMGKGIMDYDSMIVLTHFKGHAMGGFGGSMKNIAIGCASGKVGKRQVHGVEKELPANWKEWPDKEKLMELMADSAKAVTAHFGKRIVYINVLRNMSVDCDCAGARAQTPTIKDIGILASSDLLAIDQAACDLIFASTDGQDLRERIQSRHGLRQLSAMAEHKLGNPQYELITVK